ncbi:hypothetical protein Aph01nite_45950 [Acrocarpospora phusangensis]|uniref:Oxidoreductase n=1 Tax=Acrocarpospora phusangensis TaxID=1070424 RepID=A0A919USB3_9ACTN|nr:Gfo/Idh/MocA family oxidoreductase [Acrocarpospora phusangensis]GIH26285.1 hypothetical protein Aph01nite_45950 [Acrocarpospora phusangensis]
MPDMTARAVHWPRPGVVTISTGVEVREPGAGEVVVDVEVSVTSPGTERAWFLGLPNAIIDFPYTPGYLAAGRVRGTGTRVALKGAPHQSTVVVPEASAYPIPEGVAAGDAALWQLALTAMHGLEMGGYRPGEPVAVVGGGLLGIMARRLVAACGSTDCLAVASSDAKAWTAAAERHTRLMSGPASPPQLDVTSAERPTTIRGPLEPDVTSAQSPATARGHASPLERDVTSIQRPATARGHASPLERDVTSAERPATLRGHAYSLVLDVTGASEGLAVAVAVAADGGRVVVLGSPRAARAPVPVGAIYERGLSVVGSHISTLADPRAFTEEFFAHLAAGRMSFADVLTPYRAEDAPMAYRRLAFDRSFVAAVFSWREAPAAGAVVWSPAAEVRPMRFGLIGCGDIGMVNGSALLAAADSELGACFDPASRLAEEVAREHGGDVAGSLAELLARDDVEAVVVATPHDTHEEIVVAALDAGKHVLLEKPVAADLASARRVAAAGEAAATTVGMLFPQRLDDRVLRARAAIEAGLLGSPAGAVCTYLIDKPASYFIGGFSHRAPSTWRLSKRRAGGGFLVMNLIHHLDLIRYLLGREADLVYAQTTPSPAAADIEDLASVIIRFGDVVATFTGSATVVDGPGQAIRLWGDAGHVEILPESRLRSRLPVPEDLRTWTPGAGSAADLKARAFSRFVSAVRHGEPPDVTIADGLAVQATITAAYASAASGMPVSPMSCGDGEAGV